MNNFIAQVDAVLGLENVELIHFNDSKEAFASKKDRHEIPGRGTIGASLKFILHHPDLAEIPFLLELSSLEDDQMEKVLAEIHSWE